MSDLAIILAIFLIICVVYFFIMFIVEDDTSYLTLCITCAISVYCLINK